MENYLYLIAASSFSVELLFRLKIRLYLHSIVVYANKIFHIILSSGISDHWKEKIVPKYAFILLKKSLAILGILILIILLFSFFLILSNNFITLVLSIPGITLSMITSFLYYKFRLALSNE